MKRKRGRATGGVSGVVLRVYSSVPRRQRTTREERRAELRAAKKKKSLLNQQQQLTEGTK